jgi:hypothetical protein
MRNFALLFVCAAVTASSAGCWPWDIYADDEFRQALPRQEDLAVRIGEQDLDDGTSQQAELDPYADCDECCVEEIGGEEWYVSGDIYEVTRTAKWYVNGGLVATFAWIDAILEYPFTEETEDGYLWGPWRESLSRIEFRFAMDKTGAGEFSFRLEGRNINAAADDPWVVVVDGDVIAGSQPHRGAGTIVFDYDAIHEVDTSHPTPQSGLITYDFDVREYPYLVDVSIVDFEPYDGEVVDAVYHYERLSEGMAGRLSFEAEEDVWPEGEPDGVAETLEVVSRWTSTGEGKAEASVAGGSLAGDNVESFGLSECWAGSGGLYYQTYRFAEVTFEDETPDFSEVECGDVSHCPDID